MSTEEKQRRVLIAKGRECRSLMEERMNEMRAGNGSEFEGWCPPVWDGIMCWDAVPPDTDVTKPCAAYIINFNDRELAYRKCLKNGMWRGNEQTGIASWTNYTMCGMDTTTKEPYFDVNYHTNQSHKLVVMYTVGYSVSLITLLIAVIIMMCCRRLQRKSNTLHINLFVAFILRAALSFLKDRLFVGGLALPKDLTTDAKGQLQFIDEGLHWECRLIMVLLIFSISATQTWILMEGLYLYMLINWTILTERHGVKLYILLGWITPWLIVIPWVIVKYMNENTFCWNFHKNEKYFWILNGSWIATVVINFFFFLNICRVLFVRVRSNHRHDGNSKYRRFAKFVLVLIPLFGIMYIVLLVAFPGVQDHKTNDKTPYFDVNNIVYLYIEMGYNSFQGCILALLFCFLNEDVHSEIRRLWRRHRSRREDTKYLNRTLNTQTYRQTARDTPPLPLRASGDGSGSSSTKLSTTSTPWKATTPTTANTTPQSRILADGVSGGAEDVTQLLKTAACPRRRGSEGRNQRAGSGSGDGGGSEYGLEFASNGSGSSGGESLPPSTERAADDGVGMGVVGDSVCIGTGGGGNGGDGGDDGGDDAGGGGGSVVWVGRGAGGDNAGSRGGVPAKVIVLSKARDNGVICQKNQNHHHHRNHNEDTPSYSSSKDTPTSVPAFSEERHLDDLSVPLNSSYD